MMTYWPPLPDPFPPMPEGSFTRLPPSTSSREEVAKWARDNFVSASMSEPEAAATVRGYVSYWQDWVENGQ